MKANTLKPEDLDRTLVELSQKQLKLYEFLKLITKTTGITNHSIGYLGCQLHVNTFEAERLLKSLDGQGLICIELDDSDPDWMNTHYHIVVLENIFLPPPEDTRNDMKQLPPDLLAGIDYLISEKAITDHFQQAEAV